jgi:general secretion pathway protein K
VRQNDEGYAIVAAVAALAVFATLAYAVLAADRGDIDELGGQYRQARLEAAADAGLAEAVEGLAVDDPAQRWPIDGRAQSVQFEGARLTIRVEDERGKAPLDGLTELQLRRLFAGAGASGERQQTLVDSFLDWVEDEASPPRPNGAKAAYYQPYGIRPRYGAPATLDEIARIKGMDPALLARIKPALTVHFGSSGGFDRDTATPLAIAVHDAGEEGASEESSAEDQQEPDIDAERPALEIAREASLTGRTLTVDVQVRDPGGGFLERRTMLMLTGKSAPAFYVLSRD